MKNYIKQGLVILLLLQLSGCGGGSGNTNTSNEDNTSTPSEDNTSTPNEDNTSTPDEDNLNTEKNIDDASLTGYFSNTVIAGLTYTTETQSGVTTSDGAYNYLEGETITFSLGDTYIGETVPAKAAMTVFDLVPDAVIYTTSSQVRHVLSLPEYTDSSHINLHLISLSKNTPDLIALNKFSNILTFLQSLDDDANPDNGININPGIADLFLGVQTNFAQDLTKFSDNKALRIITHRALNSGLLSTAHIPNPGYSLDYYYKTQNIEHDFYILTSVTYNDREVAAYTYDADGNKLTSMPQNSDGLSRTYTYDTKGNQLTWSWDHSSEIFTNTYDANGNLLTSMGYDGVISYTYDTDGNLINESSDEYITYTYDANGNTLTAITGGGDNNELYYNGEYYDYTYTYDTRGNRLTTLVEGYFYSNNVVATIYTPELITYTYDANGNLSTRHYDDNVDYYYGSRDRVTTYTYDENGNQLSENIDEYADGSIDRVTTYTYDENSNLLSYSYDSDGDGNASSIYTYTYNALGNLLTRRYNNNDPDKSYFYTFTYDNNGNQLTMSRDSDDRVITYTYDEYGNKIGSDDSYAFEYVPSTWVAIINKVIEDKDILRTQGYTPF